MVYTIYKTGDDWGMVHMALGITIWLFNIAMENHNF